MTSPMGLVESKMSIQPIEELLDQRRTIINKLADYRAKFGPWGTYDDLRKIELSRLKTLIRIQATKDKRKISNQQCDDEAHAHPDYIEFVNAATIARAEWVRLEAQVEEIDATINRGQAVARYASAEMAHLA